MARILGGGGPGTLVNVGEVITISGLVCDFDDEVGNLVKVIGNNQVFRMQNNITDQVFGVILSKQSSTECTIAIEGKANCFTGLIADRNYFIGTDGQITSTAPIAGYVQRFGKALNTTTIEIDKTIRTHRTP